MKYEIVKLIETGYNSPATWTAITSTGEEIYIRYRYGILSARTLIMGSQQLIFSVLDEPYEDEFGFDVMRTETMQELTARVLDFSKTHVLVGI